MGSNVDSKGEARDNAERDSETEKSDAASDGSTSDDDLPLIHRGSYKGKDGTTWKFVEPIQTVRTRRENIVTHLPGTKGAAKQVNTPLKAWQCFFSDEVLQKIVDYTNIYIDIKNNYTRDRDAKNTNLEELKALIGLLYYAGVLKSSHLHTDELWNDDGTGVQIFRCGMSQQRFRFFT